MPSNCEIVASLRRCLVHAARQSDHPCGRRAAHPRMPLSSKMVPAIKIWNYQRHLAGVQGRLPVCRHLPCVRDHRLCSVDFRCF